MSKSLIGKCLVLGVIALSLVGCQEDSWPEGHACISSSQCAQSMCISGTCLVPTGDTDGDGLSNEIESKIGTDPLYFDSDYDQIPDGQEVGDSNAPTDTDGDGKIDALEHALADTDLDCIRDPYDPDDVTPETDMELIRDANCRREGVCGSQLDVIGVTCDLVKDGEKNIAVATCDYSSVIGYEPDPELRCDELDNDCDGSIDEALAYMEQDGGVRTLGESCSGMGACSDAEGMVECGRDLTVTCSVNFQGSNPSGQDELACDGIDNDCNGTVDDGVFWTDPNTGLRRTVGETCEGRGLCGLGIVECSANGADGVCSTELGGSNDESLPELCDGYDNDCDGYVDEGQSFQQGDESLSLGESCGLGACSGGEVVCQDGIATCSTLENSSDGAELCNGIDDDCDGETDEIDGLSAYCSNQGVCLSLTVVDVSCEADEPLPVCSYEEALNLELGNEESCDGLDNDCDGEADEGLYYVSDKGDHYELGSVCPGLGACAALDEGVVECTAEGGVQCTTNLAGGSAETCNGIDDDCDGIVDELEPNDQPPGLCSQKGVCHFFANVPASCVDGQWQCPYLELDTYQGEELSCDGLDNDCDGLVDEGTPKQITGTVTQALAGQPSERQHWRITPEIQGQGLLFGGWSRTTKSSADLLGDFWRYEASSGSWTILPDGPPPRAQHGAAFDATHNLFVVHGGIKNPSYDYPTKKLSGNSRSDMWLYDIDSQTWSQVTQDWSMVTGDAPIARRGHSITPVGNGVFILHGGLTNGNLNPTRVTLKATLKPIGANGGWLCFWEEVETGAGNRRMHNAFFDEVNNRVVIVGGVAPNGSELPFLEMMSIADGLWTSVNSFDLTPPNRLYPAVIAQGSVAVIHGGEAPSADGLVPSNPKNDTFLLELTTDSVVKIGAEKVPEPMRGASFLSAWVGVVELVGGMGSDQFSTRKSWHFSVSDLTWSEPASWKGPIPRTNAALVGNPWSDDIWLIGGELTTAGGTKQLFDAWKYESDEMDWTSILPAEGLPPVDAFPSNVAAILDPSNERVLMLGENLQSGDLLSFKAGNASFEMIETGGSLPPKMNSMTLMIAPTSNTVTLAGLFLNKGYVYTLDLDTMQWSPVVAQGGGPTDSNYMAAGLYDQTLITLTVQKDASLEFRSLDLGNPVWTELGSIKPPTGIQKLVGFGFDAASKQGLILLRDAQDEVKTWVADFKIPALLPLDPWWPLEETGSSFVFHPTLGAVSVGGRSQGGHITSATYNFEQICAP